MPVGADLLRVVRAALACGAAPAGGSTPPSAGRWWRPATTATSPGASTTRARRRARPARGAVALDAGAAWIALGSGVDLDLGAIAKGDAADRACALMAAGGAVPGQRRRRHRRERARAGGRPWGVAVAGGRRRLTLALERGGLATSGTDRRRWRRGGAPRAPRDRPAAGRPADDRSAPRHRGRGDGGGGRRAGDGPARGGARRRGRPRRPVGRPRGPRGAGRHAHDGGGLG